MNHFGRHMSINETWRQIAFTSQSWRRHGQVAGINSDYSIREMEWNEMKSSRWWLLAETVQYSLCQWENYKRIMAYIFECRAGHDASFVCGRQVTDFGMSKVIDSNTMLKTFCGTANYLAPEVLQTAGSGSYTKAVDCWSLGVILFIWYLYCCLLSTLPRVGPEQVNMCVSQNRPRPFPGWMS